MAPVLACCGGTGLAGLTDGRLPAQANRAQGTVLARGGGNGLAGLTDGCLPV